MDVANCEIDDIKGTPKEQYGFVANPRLPLWKNMEAQVRMVGVTELLACPKKNGVSQPTAK